jgi:glycosyltransferase involved in cell wall biosynthesis
MRTAFLERARQLFIDDCVVLDGWRTDVTDRLAALDIFLMPSSFEGMPLALLEAMSAGLCCVASDLDGMREAIKHEVTGYLCAPDNVDSWCSRLEPLVRDRGTRTSVGERAKKLARRQFSTETMARSTLAVYEEALEASHFAGSG